MSGEDFMTLTPEVASNALLHVVQMYVASLADKQRALNLAIAQGGIMQKQLEESRARVAEVQKESLKPRGFKLQGLTPQVAYHLVLGLRNRQSDIERDARMGPIAALDHALLVLGAMAGLDPHEMRQQPTTSKPIDVDFWRALQVARAGGQVPHPREAGEDQPRDGGGVGQGDQEAGQEASGQEEAQGQGG